MNNGKRKFLVAEVSKTWVDGEPMPDGPVDCIAARLEDVVNHHSQDGYDLVDWRLATTFGTVPLPEQVFGKGAGSKTQLVETIVAIFRLRDWPS